MSVLPIDEPPDATIGAPGREGFWQRLGQALDAYLVDRSRRVVPAAVLRRSRHDIARCRRLMHRGPGSRDFSGM
jgi:hypothetical protein